MSPEDPTNQSANAPILSDYLNDQGMVAIIDIFIDEIPSRIASLESSFHAGNKKDFSKMVHQLKGAGGGYGFSIITAAALVIEKKMRTPNNEWKQDIHKNLKDFVAILRRVHAGKGISRHT